MSGFNRFFFRAAMGIAATVAAASLPASASAADAVASFDGTQGSGGFTYGSTNGSTFTPFTNNAACPAPYSSCLQRSTPSSQNDLLPGAYRNTGGQVLGAFSSVDIPANSLVLHPGPEAFGQGGNNLTSVFAAFTAATAGVYNYSAAFTAIDRTPTGVGISSFTIAGLSPANVTQLAGLTNLTQGNVFTSTGSIYLAAGDVFGFIIDKGATGEYYNDSTQLAFSISAAPEPGTWAMMITGFGLAGIALRRRKTLSVATA